MPPQYFCPICEAEFAFADALIRHIEIAHPPEKAISEISITLKEMKEGVALLHDQNRVLQTIEPTPELVAELQKTMAEPMGPEEALTKPYRPVEVYQQKIKASSVINEWVRDRIFGATLLEAIPFVDVGTSMLRYLGLPDVSARTTQATEMFRSEWEYGMKPYIQRWWNFRYQGFIPEAYRLALAAAKGIIPDVYYKEAMYESGMNAYWANMWVLENYEYPSLEVALALLRRGEIDIRDFDLWMERSQLPDDVRAQVVKLKDVIPPLPDLIRMAVREAFGDHTYEEQKPALLSWGAKMGLTSAWVDRYWYSHWERIPLAQMYDNLWREHWTPEDFDRMLRIKDLHPEDRDAILKVAYRAPSIRTLGYGYDMGIMDRDFIDEMFKWRGIDPEIRDTVVESFIAYRSGAEIESIRRELLWQYSRERISRAEFKMRLMAPPLNTREDFADLWVARGDMQIERFKIPEPALEYRVVTSTEAKWMFTHGLRDENWFRAKLKELNWTDERTNVLVERAKKEMEPEVEVPPEPRKLTTAQIRSLYLGGKITAEELPAFYEWIGYGPEFAKVLAEVLVEVPVVEVPVRPYTDAWARRLYAYRILHFDELYNNYLSMGYDSTHAWDMTLATILSEEYPALSAAYRKGIITQETFLRELVELGMDGVDAIELLERTIRDFQYERIEKERDLTKAEIIKGYKKGIISTMEAARLLEDLGFEEWEAMYIIEINRVVGAGDPESYWDMRRVVESYKKARGEEWIDIPEEVFMLDAELRKKKEELEELRRAKASDEEISVKVAEVAEVEARLRKVLVLKKIE